MSRKRKKAKSRTQQRTPSTKQVAQMAHFTEVEEAFFAAGMALEAAPELYVEDDRSSEGPGLISRMLSRLMERLAIRQRVAT